MSVEAIPQASAVHPEAEEHSDHLLLDPKPQSEMNSMVLDAMHRTPLSYWIIIGVLAVIFGVGLVGGWIYQIWWGLGVAGVRRPTYWGIYITSFVFWIGLSHSGTLVSAILRVLNSDVRRSITRAPEMMTAFTLLVAVTFLGIDIGRPWRGYWIAPYPNERGLWPNFHSPFLWDEMAIITYLISSYMYLYLPLIPDLAMARDRSTGWRYTFFRILSLGWKNKDSQWKYLNKAILIMAFAIIPIAFSVHTIVSWDFAMTNMVGWHSTIFGPYFVIGAIYSGVAAVITILFIVRTTMRLDYFIRPEHFDTMGKLLLAFCGAWVYFFFADYLTEWYGGDAISQQVIALLSGGAGLPSLFFYAMLFFNILVPGLTLWNRRLRRKPVLILLVSLSINVGMYLERYGIVTSIARRNRMPFDWGDFWPTTVELMILAGSFAMFFLLYGIFSRLVPIIPVWEVREGQIMYSIRRIGKASIVRVLHLD
jgi:Ni/Fe-hydrogenase subunit HybB-like protein